MLSTHSPTKSVKLWGSGKTTSPRNVWNICTNYTTGFNFVYSEFSTQICWKGCKYFYLENVILNLCRIFMGWNEIIFELIVANFPMTGSEIRVKIQFSSMHVNQCSDCILQIMGKLKRHSSSWTGCWRGQGVLSLVTALDCRASLLAPSLLRFSTEQTFRTHYWTELQITISFIANCFI